jgi:hypothetical protein
MLTALLKIFAGLFALFIAIIGCVASFGGLLVLLVVGAVIFGIAFFIKTVAFAAL